MYLHMYIIVLTLIYPKCARHPQKYCDLHRKDIYNFTSCVGSKQDIVTIHGSLMTITKKKKVKKIFKRPGMSYKTSFLRYIEKLFMIYKKNHVAKFNEGYKNLQQKYPNNCK